MTEQTGTVSAIKPRQSTDTYRGCKIVMTYNTNSRRVDWEIQKTTVLRFTGDNADFARAKRAARRRIDRIIDGE